ncbi:hypothetical protein ABZT17_10155 [Streptomyces sp. NPDC005648]|uniref:hypothetical protein n=1 Tax=Streptomyces sp. NPDC005648 TaxID=3157044 RepID=UPI00339DBA4C
MLDLAQRSGDTAAERVFRVHAAGCGQDEGGVRVPLVGQDLPRYGLQQRGDLAGELVGLGQLAQDGGGEAGGGRSIPRAAQDQAEAAAQAAQGDAEPPAFQPGFRMPEPDEQSRLTGPLEGGAGGEQAGNGRQGRVGVGVWALVRAVQIRAGPVGDGAAGAASSWPCSWRVRRVSW